MRWCLGCNNLRTKNTSWTMQNVFNWLLIFIFSFHLQILASILVSFQILSHRWSNNYFMTLPGSSVFLNINHSLSYSFSLKLIKISVNKFSFCFLLRSYRYKFRKFMAYIVIQSFFQSYNLFRYISFHEVTRSAATYLQFLSVKKPSFTVAASIHSSFYKLIVYEHTCTEIR